MNQWDRDNLNFLLSATPEILRDWYNHVTDDDIAYALELIRAARSELEINLLQMHDNVNDCALANQILSKFRL